MKRMHWLLVAVLATTLTLGACGQQESSTTTGAAGLKSAGIDPDLGRLVPQDAVALVYMANPEAFETKLKGLISEIDEDVANEIQFDAIGAQMLPGASQYWDRTKPCAIAISLADGANPLEAIGSGQGITLVFAMTDVKAAHAGMEAQLKGAPENQRPKMKVAGSYLAFSPSPNVAWGDKAPLIAQRAPAGDMALRLDLGALVTKFRKEIDEGLGGMEEMMGAGLEAAEASGGADAGALSGMLSGMGDWVKDFVNSAELFELGVEINGSTADLRVGFTAKSGSKLDIEHSDHGDLAALAGHLPEGFPVHFLMRMEYGKLMEWMGPLMESSFEKMPEAQRGKWKAYMTEAMDMSKLLGPNFAMAMAATDNGIQAVQIADVKDAEAYKQRLEKLIATAEDMPAFSIAKGEGTMVAGVAVDSYDVTMDFKALMEMQGQAGGLPPEAEEMFGKIMPRLFGGETMRFNLATVGRQLLFTMGDTAHMESVINSLRGGKGKTPPALASAIEKAGGQPAFLMQVELREIVSQVLKMVGDIAEDVAPGEAIPTVPAGAPIPVVVWGAHEGRTYGGGISVDVGGIVKLVESMDK